MKKLSPITRDQEFMAAIHAELVSIRQLLVAMTEVGVEGAKCPVCGRTFRNERGLRAHMRIHRGE